MTEYVDMTPTWLEVWRIAVSTCNRDVIKELRTPCDMFDKIVKAKKDGATSCTFTFNEDGSTTFFTSLDTNVEEG